MMSSARPTWAKKRETKKIDWRERKRSEMI